MGARGRRFESSHLDCEITSCNVGANPAHLSRRRLGEKHNRNVRDRLIARTQGVRVAPTSGKVMVTYSAWNRESEVRFFLTRLIKEIMEECKCEKAGMGHACGQCTKPDWLSKKDKNES